VHAVQVGPANRAERQQGIGIESLGQRLFREPPELDAGFSEISTMALRTASAPSTALEALRASEGRLPDFTELAARAATETAARLGWPAPPDPAGAIDRAEYDLAILDRLARAGRPELSLPSAKRSARTI
jgi:hypothetical protein